MAAPKINAITNRPTVIVTVSKLRSAQIVAVKPNPQIEVANSNSEAANQVLRGRSDEVIPIIYTVYAARSSVESGLDR